MSTNDVEIDLEKHEVFSSAISGLPKVAELIATFPFEDRQRALETAKLSYFETARGLGYEEATALRWAEAVMFRLQFTFTQAHAAA
jgi:hypothetical protein